MDCLPKSDYFKFRPDTLANVRKLYGFNSADDVRQAVDVLDSWVKKQQHFTKKEFRRHNLEMMIIQCKGSVEKAKSRLERLCTLRTRLPQFFGDFDVRADFKMIYGEVIEYLEVTIIECKGSVEKAKRRLERLCTLRTRLPQYFGDFDVRKDFKMLHGEVMYTCYLPKMTCDYYRILVVKEPGHCYDGTPVTVATFQNIILLLELQKRLDYAVGQLLFVDFTKTDIVNVVSNLNLVELRNGFSVVQQGYGLRVKGIHVLTTSKYMHTLFKFLQAVFSSKVMSASRIHVHETLDSVYEFIPKDLLPIEYGGKERSINTLFEEFTALLSSEEQRAHIRETLAARTDEGLRSGGFSSQDLGMPGTFRTLTID